MAKDTKQRLFEMMFGVTKLPINENNIRHLTKEQFLSTLPRAQSLNEIDWDTEFGDTNQKCHNPDAIVEWLNSELERLSHNRGAKTKDVIQSKINGKPGSVPNTIIMSQGNIEKLIDKKPETFLLEH
jgi:hypothetical protein